MRHALMTIIRETENQTPESIAGAIADAIEAGKIDGVVVMGKFAKGEVWRGNKGHLIEIEAVGRIQAKVIHSPNGEHNSTDLEINLRLDGAFADDLNHQFSLKTKVSL